MREKTQQAILGSITRLIVLLALCIPPPTYATLGIDWLANHQAQEEGHYSTKAWQRRSWQRWKPCVHF